MKERMMQNFKVVYYDNVHMQKRTPIKKSYTSYNYSREAEQEAFDHVHPNGEIISISEIECKP